MSEGRTRARALAITVTRALALALVLLTFGWSRAAEAAPPPTASGPTPIEAPSADERVLVRVVPDDRQTSSRLEAELDISGLEAVALEIEDESILGPELLEHVDAAGVGAAVEIVFGDGHVDVWVADGNTGKTLHRRLDLSTDSDEARPRTLAIAAVELLRASRLELSEEPPGPARQETEGERPPQERRGGIELPNTASLGIGPMVLGSPGGLSVAPHIELYGRWAPPRRFALRVSLWIPSFGSLASDPRGDTRVLITQAFIEPQLRLPGGAWWFHPELGLGLGGALVVTQGTANEGFRNAQGIRGGFSGYGHVGLGFEVNPRVWLRLDGYVGIMQPALEVLYGELVDGEVVFDSVATWGLPYMAGSLGVEVWF